MKATSKIMVPDYSGNFSETTTTGTGAGDAGEGASLPVNRFAASGGCSIDGTKPATGAGLASMAAALDAATVEAIQAGAGNDGLAAAVEVAAAAASDASIKTLAAAGKDATPSAADDYRLCNARATCFNLRLMGNGCSSFWRVGVNGSGWEPKMQDAVQAAMLHLQLWRRGLKLVRGGDGAEKIEPDFSCKLRTAGAVVWKGLGAGFWGVGRRGATTDTGLEFALAFEQWREDCNEGGAVDGESAVERVARRRAAVPAAIAAFIAAAGIGAGALKNAHIAKRRAMAEKLQSFLELVLSGEPSKSAAVKAGYLGDDRHSAFQNLVNGLRQAGIKIESGAWRNKLAQGPRRTPEQRAADAALAAAVKAANAKRRKAARATLRKRQLASAKRLRAQAAALKAARRQAQAVAAAAAAGLTVEQWQAAQRRAARAAIAAAAAARRARANAKRRKHSAYAARRAELSKLTPAQRRAVRRAQENARYRAKKAAAA